MTLRLARPALKIAAALAVLSGGPGLAAGSVEEASTDLAKGMLAQLPVGAAASVAISTFTHAGNTCSDLSNYLSEILMPSVLLEGRERGVTPIARSQLAAIFRELKLVYDGTISPGAAQEIGRIAAVDAIITGTLTPVGDRMMVIANLMATSNGAILGALTADFPITGTVQQMLATRSADLCGFDVRETGAIGSRPEAVESGPQGRPSPDPTADVQTDSFLAQLTALSRDPGSGQTTWALRFSNRTDRAIGLSYYPNTLAVTDSFGASHSVADQPGGLKTCYVTSAFNYCNTSDARYASLLRPRQTVQWTFTSSPAAGAASDGPLSASFDIIVTSDAEKRAPVTVESIAFYDLAPATR